MSAKIKPCAIICFMIICACLMLVGSVSASEPGISVVEKSFDGNNVIQAKNFTFVDINTTMKAVGAPDGILLSFQGPTFEKDNLWDPDQKINVDNLNDTVIGVSVKELLQAANVSENAVNVSFVASDGYKVTLPAKNVFTPPEEQGEVILAYWCKDPEHTAELSGYRLYFVSPDGIYSDTDMQKTLTEEYYHYYINPGDNIAYPSAKGLSISKVSEIDVQMPE